MAESKPEEVNATATRHANGDQKETVDADPTVDVKAASSESEPKDVPTTTIEAKTESAVKETTEKAETSERPSDHRSGYRPKSNQFKKNIKSNFTSLPESNDHDEIRKQVEFYFSDSNLIQDQFLLDQVGGSKNTPVPIRIIHSFKRMRHFQPYEEVVNALKESEFLEVNEDDEVYRKEPLPETVTNQVDRNTVKTFADKAQPRSIYAKGFGAEGPSTQVDIEEFFAPYGPINAVRLRRSPQMTFKGSVFVEFKDEDTQKAFLALEKKPVFNEKELLIMSKKEYVDMKAEDIRTGKIKPSSDSRDWKADRDRFQKNGFRDSRGRGRGGRGNRGGRSDRGQRRRSEERDQSEEREAEDASKKRGREEDGPGDQPEPKKGKTDDADEA